MWKLRSETSIHEHSSVNVDGAPVRAIIRSHKLKTHTCTLSRDVQIIIFSPVSLRGLNLVRHRTISEDKKSFLLEYYFFIKKVTNWNFPR